MYIESQGKGRRAQEIRDELARRLARSHIVDVVDAPAKADAVFRSSEQIWTTGRVALNPRSHSATEPLYEGFLSVEVLGKDDQTLWSYLVTTSKFPWGGVTSDLARQLVSKFLNDSRAASQTKEIPSSAASSRMQASLKGAGATFPAPLYQRWFELFEALHADVHISYEAVGSGEGIRRLQKAEVDFGASERPLSDQAMSDSHHHFLHIPMVLGAVVPIYHVPGVRGRVNFTPEALAGIYLGKIRKWNDSQIKSSNPGISFPDAEITVVHRSDASGTSFVWTDYLSKVSPEWKSTAGADVRVQWPVGIGEEYNEGVAAAVQRVSNSIGYVEFIYAIQHELSFGAVRNARGQFVKADLASVTEAARNTESADLRVSITNAPGKDAYPIATYTWLLLPQDAEDKNNRSVLLDLVRWILTDGQKSCSALGYAPLPPEVAQRGLESLSRTTSGALSQSQDRASWISFASTPPIAFPGTPKSK